MHHCREVNECEKVLEEKPKCSRSSVRTMGMKKESPHIRQGGAPRTARLPACFI